MPLAGDRVNQQERAEQETADPHVGGQQDARVLFHDQQFNGQQGSAEQDDYAERAADGPECNGHDYEILRFVPGKCQRWILSPGERTRMASPLAHDCESIATGQSNLRHSCPVKWKVGIGAEVVAAFDRRRKPVPAELAEIRKITAERLQPVSPVRVFVAPANVLTGQERRRCPESPLCDHAAKGRAGYPTSAAREGPLRPEPLRRSGTRRYWTIPVAGKHPN